MSTEILLCTMKAQRKYACGAVAAYALANQSSGRLACRHHVAQAADDLRESFPDEVVIKMVAVNVKPGNAK